MSSQSFWRLISMRLGPSDSPKQTSLVELLPCWTVEAWQSHRKQRSMDLEGGRRGVSVPPPFFFYLTDAGECSSSNSGVSSGKNISSIMEWGWACHHYQWEEEACQSTQRGKRHNPRQRITGGMDGRREEKRERGKQHTRSWEKDKGRD